MKIRIGKIVEYKISKLFPGTIIVNKINPDKSKEAIGFITQEIAQDGDSIIYVCRDAQGKEFCVAGDWLLAQRSFEKYAKKLDIIYPNIFRNTNWYKKAEREKEIKMVRIRKGRNEKSKTITNLNL